MEFGLPAATIQKIRTVFSAFPAIERAVIFGSRAKGNYKTGSDIDLTLFGEKLAFDILADVLDTLDELLLPYTFDISLYAKIDNPALREHIDRVGKIFYETEGVGKNNASTGAFPKGNAPSLPKGWEFKKLGEVAKATYGYTESACYNEVGPKFLRITDIQNDGVNWETVPFCKISDFNLEKYTLKNGDIVFARTGATTGKSFLILNPPLSVFASYLIKVHITDKKLTPEYLYLFFQTQAYWDKINAGVSGSAQGGFNATKLADLNVPLPPLPEQKRIVSILDKAFAAIDKAKANAEKNLANAKELFESYLNGVFANLGVGWDICNLEKYIKLIDYRGRTPVKTESGVRLITAKNVKLGYLQLEPQEFINPDNYNSWMTRGIPNMGDVIFTTEAPLANVAQIDTEEKLAFAQRIIVMQPREDKIDQTFLKYMLLSNPIRNKILIRGTGATVLGIKSSLLKKIEIYFPKSISAQRAIVAILDELSAETKKLESIYRQKLTDLDELKKSILKKAFEGKL